VQQQLLQLITKKEQAMEKFHQHLANFPTEKNLDGAFQRSLTAVEKTVAPYNVTIKRIEESLACFAILALDVQNQARERELKRLDTFRP